MSWRENLQESEILLRTNEFYHIKGVKYDFEWLLNQIGDRDVVVDACLPPQLAEDLRRRNINAVWVPAILGDGVSDDEIERLLLIGQSLLWETKKQKVLLTRDVCFSRKLKSKAILVKYRSTPVRVICNQELRKELKLLRSNEKDSRQTVLCAPICLQANDYKNNVKE